MTYTPPRTLVTIDAYEITLFGRPTIRYREKEIAFARSEELLFLLLARNPDHWVSRAQMAEAVWEDETGGPFGKPLTKDLKNPKARLKAKLGDLAETIIEYDGGARMRLLITPGSVIDAHVVEIEARRARRAVAERDWPIAREAAQRVIDLVGAEFAAGRSERWVVAEREFFRDMRLEALQHFVHADLNLGDSNPHAALEGARALVRHNGANVDWVLLLMVAWFRCGCAEDAQQIYRDFVSEGGTPSKKMQEFFDALTLGKDPHVADAGHIELPVYPSPRAKTAREDMSINTDRIATLPSRATPGWTPAADEADVDDSPPSEDRAARHGSRNDNESAPRNGHRGRGLGAVIALLVLAGGVVMLVVVTEPSPKEFANRADRICSRAEGPVDAVEAGLDRVGRLLKKGDREAGPVLDRQILGVQALSESTVKYLKDLDRPWGKSGERAQEFVNATSDAAFAGLGILKRMAEMIANRQFRAALSQLQNRSEFDRYALRRDTLAKEFGAIECARVNLGRSWGRPSAPDN